MRSRWSAMSALSAASAQGEWCRAELRPRRPARRGTRDVADQPPSAFLGNPEMRLDSREPGNRIHRRRCVHAIHASAALLVLLPAAAGARLIASNLSVALDTAPSARRRPTRQPRPAPAPRLVDWTHTFRNVPAMMWLWDVVDRRMAVLHAFQVVSSRRRLHLVELRASNYLWIDESLIVRPTKIGKDADGFDVRALCGKRAPHVVRLTF